MTSPLSSHISTPALLLDSHFLNDVTSSLHTSASASKTSAAAATSSDSTTCVVVHPIVLLSVLDHHTRRPDSTGRVIGTLLGKRDGDKIEVTNCFAVPHAERGEEVAIGKDFNRQMLSLHVRTNRNETIVGWYATALPPSSPTDVMMTQEDGGTTRIPNGIPSSSLSSSSSPHVNSASTSSSLPSSTSLSYRCIADTSSLIHDFYADECEDDPIHLVIDTSLQSDVISLRAYKSEAITIFQEPVANVFHEVRLILRSSESEKIALDKMIQSQQWLHPTPIPISHPMEEKGEVKDREEDGIKDHPALTLASETNTLQTSMEKLYEMLVTASSYVDQVVSGKIPADDSMGRLMADTLASIPRVRPELFDKVFSDTLQDLLMVTYLSNITRTQLTIAEKINAILDQPLK